MRLGESLCVSVRLVGSQCMALTPKVTATVFPLVNSINVHSRLVQDRKRKKVH